MPQQNIPEYAEAAPQLLLALKIASFYLKPYLPLFLFRF